ncbi:MAG: AmmeMemoRadiSam system protein B [Chloroflexota bacterium]
MSLDPSAPVKLRPLDVRPIMQNGQQAYWLRDPLALSEHKAVMPAPLAPLLALCDGTRNVAGLRASLAVRYGLPLSEAAVLRILAALDDALLLDNERARQAQAEALAIYRAAAQRVSPLAGESYPAEADALRRYLDGFAPGDAAAADDLGALRGLISPHIDYARGGATYARTWGAVGTTARAAELVVILGTDHYGGPGRITLTRQSYATPYGALPTAVGLVDRLADALGGEAAYAEELHHRSEHSVELSAVWLHHTRQGQPCALVPILCGSFHEFVQGARDPGADPAINAFVAALRPALAERPSLVVASGDLAHMGPAFGGQPLGIVDKAVLKAADEAMLAAICAGGTGGTGDAEAFLAGIRAEGDRRNVCGVPAIYLLLRLLAPAQGRLITYDQCPADERQTSWVSVCGLALS